MVYYRVFLILLIAACAVLFLAFRLVLARRYHHETVPLFVDLKDRSDKWYFILLVFLAVAVLFNIDKAVFGPLATIPMHDTFDSEFARYKNYGDLLFRYGIFQWYPGAPGGMPAFASQFTPLYPVAALCHFFPMWLVYSIELVFLMAAAGYGSYRLLREFFQVDRAAAFFGGVIFCLITQVQANNIVPAVFNYVFPLFFMLFIDLTNRSFSTMKRLLAGLGILLLFSLSYPAITVPMFGFLQLFLVLFLNENKKDRLRHAVFTVIVWAGYLLLSAPVLYGLFSYLPFAHRTYDTVAPVAGSWNGLVIFLKECNYVLFYFHVKCGLLVTVFAAIPSILSSKKMRWMSVLLAAVLLISGFYMSPLTGIFSKTILAKFDLVHFVWLLPLVSLLFSVLGALELAKRPGKRTASIVCAVAGAAYGLYMTYSGILLTTSDLKTVGKYLPYLVANIVIAAAVLVPVFFRKRIADGTSRVLPAWLVPVILLLFVVVASQVKYIRYFGEEAEDTPYQKYFGNHREFDIIKKSETLPFRAGFVDDIPGLIASHGIETVDGRGPLFNKDYKDIVRLIVMKQLVKPAAKALFDEYWYNLYINNGEGGWNVPLLLLINTKYLFSINYDPAVSNISAGVVRTESDMGRYLGPFQRFIRTNYSYPLYIYRLKDTFERAFLASRVSVLQDDRQVLQAMSLQTVRSLRETAFYSSPDLPGEKTDDLFHGNENAGMLTLLSYSPDRLVYRANTAGPSVMIVTVNYHPNWKAFVDGKETKVYRTDHAFQSILLKESGEHLIRLQYNDPGLKWAWLAAFLGLLAVFSPLVLVRTKKTV